MSTRAIASATGNDRKTIMSDARLLAQNGPVENGPREITGVNGKTYTPRPLSSFSLGFGSKNECIELYTGGQRLLTGRLLPASSIHS